MSILHQLAAFLGKKFKKYDDTTVKSGIIIIKYDQIKHI
jgi:hypothetical protein